NAARPGSAVASGRGIRREGLPHGDQPHRPFPGDDRGRRAHHDLRPILGRRRGLSRPGARGGGPVSRRVTLPGADELFRATSTGTATATGLSAEDGSGAGLVVENAEPGGGHEPARTVTALRSRPTARNGSRRPTGRE